VVPAATEPVVLKALSVGGDIEGQTAVMDTPDIQRVSVIRPTLRCPRRP